MNAGHPVHGPPDMAPESRYVGMFRSHDALRCPRCSKHPPIRLQKSLVDVLEALAPREPWCPVFSIRCSKCGPLYEVLCGSFSAEFKSIITQSQENLPPPEFSWHNGLKCGHCDRHPPLQIGKPLKELFEQLAESAPHEWLLSVQCGSKRGCGKVTKVKVGAFKRKSAIVVP